jgi:hypothetical protein
MLTPAGASGATLGCSRALRGMLRLTVKERRRALHRSFSAPSPAVMGGLRVDAHRHRTVAQGRQLKMPLLKRDGSQIAANAAPV